MCLTKYEVKLHIYNINTNNQQSQKSIQLEISKIWNINTCGIITIILLNLPLPTADIHKNSYSRFYYYITAIVICDLVRELALRDVNIFMIQHIIAQCVNSPFTMLTFLWGIAQWANLHAKMMATKV